MKKRKLKKSRRPKAIPGKLEWYNGKLLPVVNGDRVGWWRFHDHYDRNGYCDNPARGY
jgi:hypothetical protein